MLASAWHCTECGAPLRGSSGLGLCSACALAGALRVGRDELGEASEPTQPRSEGTRFGDYDLLEEIARGGMGVVYRARQRSLNRIVALKVLLGGAFAGATGKQRLLAEAAAAARLHHPNIVTVHEAGEWDGQPFYSMELIDGQTLADLVRQGPVPAQRAARYVALVARAVHYAHSEGLLHRDLKPSNVLLDARDQPQVTDFGLAKRFTWEELTATDARSLTLSGQALGSPAYMPPEQALGARGKLTPACDVYSLGAILYELVTGRPPFQGETPHAVIDQLKSQEPVPPRRLNVSVPVDLETVCLRCLEKEASRRYPSAQDLAEDLERFGRGDPVRARPLGAFARAVRVARRHPLVTALAAVSLSLILAILSVLVASATRIRESRDDARSRLAESLVSEARALRAAGGLAHRADSLARLSEARRLDQSGHLQFRIRREAIASLARADVRRVTATNLPACPDLMLMCFDSRFERCALGDVANGGITVFQVKDEARLTHLAVKAPDEIAGFSPDGRFLSLRYGGSVGLWDLESGECVLPTEANKGEGIAPGAFSPDGSFYARAEPPGQVVIYSLSQPRTHRPQRLHLYAAPAGAEVLSLAWSPNSDALALCLGADAIAVCEAVDGRVRWSRSYPGGAWSVSWNRGLNAIAFQARPDTVWIVRAEDGALLRHISAPADISATSAIAANGRLMATASERFGTRLLDPLIESVVGSVGNGAWHLHFDAAGLRLGTLFDAGRPAWLECLPSPVLVSLRSVTPTSAEQVLEFAADSRRLLSLTGDGAVVWDIERGCEETLAPVRRAVGATFADDARRLLITAGDALLEWEQTTAPTDGASRPLPRRIYAGKRLWGVAVCPERGWRAVADHLGGSVSLLGRDHRRLRDLGPLEFPGYVAFSPKGEWLACGAGAKVYVWALDALEKPPIELSGVGEVVRFSPDGRWLLTMGRELGLWDTQTWKLGPALPLEANNAAPIAAAISPDGRWLAATQHDREIHLVELASRRVLTVFEGPGEGRILRLAFSPDGRRLAAARDRGEVQLWDLSALRVELRQLGLDWQRAQP